MDGNPFAPPTAELAPAAPGAAATADYYVVARRKFWVLFVATMSMYAVYWSYRQWAIAKRRHGLAVWPVMRGLFLVFFMHALADRIADAARRTGAALALDLRARATLIVVLLVASRVLDRLVAKDIGFPWLDILSFATIPALAHLFWGMQQAINAVGGDPEGAANARFSAANILWLVLGGLFWLLAIIGFVYVLLHPGAAPEP